MSHLSLFGYLATQFTTSPENLATEALNYILRSEQARSALLALISETASVPLNLPYTFHTQVAGEDRAIPDLVGFDVKGQQSLIIEAKFWAGLTENQPLAYLKRLPADSPGVLVFLAPAARLSLLWHELTRRCHEAHLDMVQGQKTTDEAWSATIGLNHCLVLMSWRRLLAFLQRELELTDEKHTIADIAQLQGLCEKMDTDAFLPLQSEELTSAIPRRILQYHQLVEEITNVLGKDSLVSIAGRRPIASREWYGRTLDLNSDIVLFLSFNVEKWSRLAATPLWLSIFGPNWTAPPATARKALLSLEIADTPQLYVESDHLTIPLFIATGEEQDDVIRAIVLKIHQVIELLQPLH